MPIAKLIGYPGGAGLSKGREFTSVPIARFGGVAQLVEQQMVNLITTTPAFGLGSRKGISIKGLQATVGSNPTSSTETTHKKDYA